VIFEEAEIYSLLYIFEGGASWKGSDLCARSHLVSKKITTSNGLRLGLSAGEVKQILGTPTFETPEKPLYFTEYPAQAPTRRFREFRPNNPRLRVEDITVNAYVAARFTNTRLTYLAIGRSEVW
jgi:hypothetical protein